jgi:LacI family transcriptional regulator
MPPKKTTAATGRATIKHVAVEAGVSKSTVSLVLQDSPLIKPDTAAKVRAAAEKLGYVYNRQAADLRRKTSNIVGVVINDLGNPFFSELLVGMERRLVDAGYICLIAHTDERLDVQDKVLASMREHRAAGLILCPAIDTPESLRTAVAGWGIPLVVVVRALGRSGYDFVGSDYEGGVQQATEHLIGQGHERIAFLGRVGVGQAYEQRRAGFDRAMKHHHLPVAPDWIVDVAPTRAGGYDGMQKVLSLEARPSAAVCYNDAVAFGALSALGERGLKAGEDFSVIGFDGVGAAAYSNPPLTTMETNPELIGATAADVLLQRIADPRRAPVRRIEKTRLIVRQSSGAVPRESKRRLVKTAASSRRPRRRVLPKAEGPPADT